MKFRLGFVSNSSSSSFVICYDKSECSIEEFKRVFSKIPYKVRIYDSFKMYNEVVEGNTLDDQPDLDNCFVVSVEIPWYEVHEEVKDSLRELKDNSVVKDFFIY